MSHRPLPSFRRSQKAEVGKQREQLMRLAGSFPKLRVEPSTPPSPSLPRLPSHQLLPFHTQSLFPACPPSPGPLPLPWSKPDGCQFLPKPS